jgi:hypothetical protein
METVRQWCYAICRAAVWALNGTIYSVRTVAAGAIAWWTVKWRFFTASPSLAMLYAYGFTRGCLTRSKSCWTRGLSVSESDEHKAIIRYFRERYPEHHLALRVSANGIHRGRGPSAMRRIAKEKAHGFVTGEADIAILLPRGGFGCLLIEHKSDEAMKGATEAQLNYIQYHNANGNCAAVTKGVDMAIAAIDIYMQAERWT